MNTLVLQFSTCAAPPWYQIDWSKWIRRAGHTPFSHVDVVMEDGSLLGASNSPKAPVTHGNPCGVAVRPHNYLDPYGGFAYRRRMVLRTDRADDIRAITSTQIGKPFDGNMIYDMLGDRFPGCRDWHLTDVWRCSELIAWGMEMGGFWDGPLNWPKNKLSPTDLCLVCLADPRWINSDTFWRPVPNLIMGKRER